MSWCTIESDPGVFSELIQTFGIKEISVEEIYDLDLLQLAKEASYGLIFLFKWRQETDSLTIIPSDNLPDLFFAKQIVQNACATQAILSVLLNQSAVPLSPLLQNLKDFTMVIDSESKGIAIGNSEEIRVAHNSFQRPEPLIQEESKSKRGKSEDVYHFIAYIPFQGQVYE